MLWVFGRLNMYVCVTLGFATADYTCWKASVCMSVQCILLGHLKLYSVNLMDTGAGCASSPESLSVMHVLYLPIPQWVGRL